MKPIVVATHNPGKMKEFKYILRHWNVQLMSLEDLGLDELDIHEDGETFLDNARIKVETLRQFTYDPIIGDDSGLCIHALDNRPGIHSSRFGGRAPFSVKRKLLLREMEDRADRTAHFTCAVTLLIDDKLYSAEGAVYGEIAKEDIGDQGFGYDSIFYYPPADKTFGQMEMEEKHSVSHRYEALKALEDILRREDPDFLR